MYIYIYIYIERCSYMVYKLQYWSQAPDLVG